ncbi:MAG: hypothetical protein ACHP83_14695 [Burkholderiales bacterium]
MTSKRAVVRGVLCAWLVGCATASVRAHVPAGPDVVLVHAFRIPDGDSWGRIAIDLSSGSWRVGGPDGPVAGEAQLRQALRALEAVEVGGRCAGWVDGATAYPCGFSLRDIDWAGVVAQRYAAIAVDQQSVVVAAARADVDMTAEQHAALVTASPRADDERFVALRLPWSYLGDKGQTYGGTLQFEIRALSNGLAPSTFDRSSGLIVLRARLLGERS